MYSWDEIYDLYRPNTKQKIAAVTFPKRAASLLIKRIKKKEKKIIRTTGINKYIKIQHIYVNVCTGKNRKK